MPKDNTRPNPSLYYCFTIWPLHQQIGPDEPLDMEAPKALPYQYLIYQSEIGDDGREHIQGYVVLKNRMRATALINICPGHYEQRRGTHLQAKEYCRKDPSSRTSEVFIYGDDSEVPQGRGQRTDLLALQKDIDSGKTYVELATDHFGSWLRAEKGIRSYRNIKTEHRKYQDGEKPKIVILWGPSGTGKSTKAMKEYPGAYWLTKPTQRTTEILWQDYEGQDTVVFDEFYSWIPYDQLLRICDYYPYVVRMLYGSAKLQAKTFVFTSNMDPLKWYEKVEDKSAWNRRVQEFGTIIYLGETFNK